MKEEKMYKGYEIILRSDDWGESPREWENLGTIVTWSPRYPIGDIDGLREFPDPEDFRKWVTRHNAICLPVYAYIHSGITIATTPFSCPWDSGQMGWIYVTAKNARKAFGWKRITAKREQLLRRYLEEEIREYDTYLTEGLWAYEIQKDGELVDACGGYVGQDNAESSAREYIDWANPWKVSETC